MVIATASARKCAPSLQSIDKSAAVERLVDFAAVERLKKCSTESRVHQVGRDDDQREKAVMAIARTSDANDESSHNDGGEDRHNIHVVVVICRGEALERMEGQSEAEEAEPCEEPEVLVREPDVKDRWLQEYHLKKPEPELGEHH